MKKTLFAAMLLLPISISAAAADDFADYPAMMWSGKSKAPDFKGAQKEFSGLRTRLGDAAKQRVDFAGKYVVAEIGCGSGCKNAFIIDKSSGNIIQVPFGGETNMYLNLVYRHDSALMKVYWEEFADVSPCKTTQVLLKGDELFEVGPRGEGPREACPSF